MTPSTEAGRRFVALWENPAMLHLPPFAGQVAAIEAEARAAVLADLAKQVAGLIVTKLYTMSGLDTTIDSRMVNRAAVLRLISEKGARNE